MTDINTSRSLLPLSWTNHEGNFFKTVPFCLPETGGTKVFIIEQESYQGKAPLACMQENFDIMKNWGY